jgi:glucosamine--fructose-6-phosphate aminotransferase (isomerizing)
MVDANGKLGFHTRTEIHSQPRCWEECLRRLKQDPQVEWILQNCSNQRRWLFMGCGSSYYLAQAAASTWKAVTGLTAQAIPASELLLFPDLILDRDSPFQPVLISRSGHTSEILESADYLKSKEMPPVAVTCAPDQDLEQRAAATLCLPAADEKSTVMTRSFTSMLLGIQFLAGRWAANEEFLDALDRLPDLVQPALEGISSALESFVAAREFEDYVWLGQGPFYGLACEGALKVKEMSCSYAQNFHTLEFRHGPKSIVGPETLIMFQLSEVGYQAEREVVEEVKALGGAVMAVAHETDERVRKAADLLFELHMPGHEYARLAAHILPAQLLGFYTGLKKRIDPDHPRHLSRVVILNARS